jgi:HlyD family secretion protein
MSQNNNENNQAPAQLTPEQLKQLMALQQMMKAGGGAPPQLSKKQKIVQATFQKMQQMVQHLDRFVNFITKKTDAERNDVVQAARSPILFGVYVVLIFVGFGGLWAALAPLDSAATAIGIVISDTNKKIIQHQEGGIIKKIFVQQGDKVKEGESLIELEDTRARTQYEGTLAQYRVALANEARLIAERDLLDEVHFPEFLTKDSNIPEVEKTMRVQSNLFKSRGDEFRAEKESLRQKIEQLHKQVDANEAKKVASAKTLEVLNDRLKAGKELLSKGYMQKAAFHQLEAQAAGAKSELATVEISIASNHQEITRAELELLNLQNKYTIRTLSELKDAQIQAAGLKEQYTHASEVLSRIVIKSPVDGIINRINYHTIGGVIGPGQEVLEISPINDVLIIEAKVPQKNIDSVHAGLVAKIRFSAFKARTTPLFIGKVISISPDLVQERNQALAAQTGGEPFYSARIEIDMEEFNKVAKAKNLVLHPGMQAEVQIVTGTRTLLRYMLDPVTDTMFKAFKEK